MGKIYAEEVDKIPSTYQWAKSQDIKPLCKFVERWSGNYAVIVGSGGSYTAAVIISQLREAIDRSPTKPLSTLEFLSTADRVSNTRVFLLSAEGKNNDVLAAAHRAISSDLSTAALTLTPRNPLIDLATAPRSG